MNAIHQGEGAGHPGVSRECLSRPARSLPRGVSAPRSQAPPLGQGRRSHACCRQGMAGWRGAQSWGAHRALLSTWKSNELRSAGFWSPPASPVSTNTVWAALTHPSPLLGQIQINKTLRVSRLLPGVLPSTCHPDLHLQLLAGPWLPLPGSSEGRWFPPGSVVTSFPTLLPPMPAYPAMTVASPPQVLRPQAAGHR